MMVTVDDKEPAGAQGGQHHLALPKGTKLFEFEIEQVLGHGGFGITYRATDTLLQESVAIKEFLPNELAIRVSDESVKAKTTGDQSDFKALLKAFLEEARMIARFRHPNIIQVRRFFELHGTGYIVLEYENGQTLSERLRSGTMPESELRPLLLELLNGLEAVHNRAILHRDLKPSNIIIRKDGTPVLIDFGAARDFIGRNSRSITAIAAPGYSPPEQYGVGGQQGPWTDFYALGAIAYRCVTGEAPVDSLRRLRDDPLPSAAEAAKGKYDKKLLSVIDWCLQIDESKRPSSVAELRAAIEGGKIAKGKKSDKTSAKSANKVVDVTTDASGNVLIELSKKTSADILELALHATPPGRYLQPSRKGNAEWSSSPHYFSVERVDDEDDQPVYALPAEVARLIKSGAQVAMSSSDDFIRATTEWPSIARGKGSKGSKETKGFIPPFLRENYLKVGAALVALLIAAGAVALGLGGDFMCAQFGKCSADRQAFERIAGTPACAFAAAAAEFKSTYEGSALLTRVSALATEKANQCRQLSQEAYLVADQCATPKEASDPCGVGTCFQTYLTAYPNGPNAATAQTRMDRAKATCRAAEERSTINSATVCATATPCEAEQCFGDYRARFADGTLRGQMTSTLADAARRCTASRAPPPLHCGVREVEKNGACVAKTCAAGFALAANGDCVRLVQRAPAPQPGAGTGAGTPREGQVLDCTNPAGLFSCINRAISTSPLGGNRE